MNVHENIKTFVYKKQCKSCKWYTIFYCNTMLSCKDCLHRTKDEGYGTQCLCLTKAEEGVEKCPHYEIYRGDE